MDPSKLEVLSTVKEITGFLNIQAHHPNFTNLNAFRNLEVIGGRHLTEYFSSLYIVKTSLVSLNMRKLNEIRSGSVAILENEDLCYAQDINWQKIMKSQSHNTLLQNNRPIQNCMLEAKTCDAQCSSDGCWGPGKGMCLACKGKIWILNNYNRHGLPIPDSHSTMRVRIRLPMSVKVLE